MRTDHRRPVLRRYLGLSIGHVSPEAAAGGAIALVEDGDPITIDIRTAASRSTFRMRSWTVAARRWRPRRVPTKNRQRTVSAALRAYAALATVGR